MPIDGFFEWRTIKGAHAKQPYAIAMRDGSPFALAGLWENWRNPNTGEWERTFAIITVSSNELVRQIHDRMPVILEPASYDRWLALEPDPSDVLITYPSEPMTMWPISTRVNKPENDDPSLLDRTGALRRMGSTEVRWQNVRSAHLRPCAGLLLASGTLRIRVKVIKPCLQMPPPRFADYFINVIGTSARWMTFMATEPRSRP